MALVAPTVPEDEVHIWTIDTAEPLTEGPGLEERLDPREQARAERFVRSAERSTFVGVHVVMREILAFYLSVLPHDVVYEYSCAICGRPHGKPSALSLHDDRQVEFNMARSGQLGVVAVVAQGRVGVDLERIDQDIDETEVLPFFTAPERLQVMDSKGQQRRHDCLTVWTRKEAYAKALGVGLSRPLDDYEVSVPPAEPRLRQPAADDTSTWFMANLPLPSPYVGTVVAEGGPKTLRVFNRSSGKAPP